MPRRLASFAAGLLAAGLLAAGFAFNAAAEEAIIIRTSAPSLPVAMRVQTGQMLDLPRGAAVTLLFRDGRMATLQGGEGARHRVEKPTALAETPVSEALRAAAARPQTRTVLGATRGPDVIAALEAMRRGAFPEGDYIAQFAAGCRTAACQALELFADERTALALHVRLAPPGETGPIEVRVNRDAYVACWDRAAGRLVAGLDGAAPLERNRPVSAPQPNADIACAASVTPFADPAKLAAGDDASLPPSGVAAGDWAFARP